MSGSSPNSPFRMKSENSPNTGIIKNTPLAASEYSYPFFMTFVSAKSKSTKGDTATVTEVLIIVYFPSLTKYTTIIWSVWSNHSLFLTMLDQVRRDSTDDKPLMLYSENGAGKNNMYEVLFQNSNRYSLFAHPANEDIQLTAQVHTYTEQ